MKIYARSWTFLLTLLLYLVVPFHNVFAQSECDFSDKLSIDIQLAPIITNSQILSLAALGVDSEGAGPQVVTGIMRNETDERLENLYFQMNISVGNTILAELTQRAAYPFSLEPRQLVYATNNDIAKEELPGVEESLRFDGGLTTEGEDFIENEIVNPTELPSGIYRVYVSVSQVTNACGRVILDEETAEFGAGESGAAIIDELSIALRTPGAEIGSTETITNPLPQFSWEGDPNIEYRVIVVSDEDGDGPDFELDQAFNTAPLAENGTLIAPYEYLDVRVNGTSLQYPSAGSTPLATQTTYYWQVSTILSNPAGDELLISDIWNFTLIDPTDQASAAAQEIDQETIQALVALIGTDIYTELGEDGFFFDSIEYDQQEFSGVVGIQMLSEILEKINNGDIVVRDN